MDVGWVASGPQSPILQGDTQRYEIDGLPAGPTCRVAVRYPSGTTQSGLNAHTFSAAGSWVWKWAVPSTAGLGTATLTSTCTYAGITRGGDATHFTVSTFPQPTTDPNWTVTATVGDAVYVSPDFDQVTWEVLSAADGAQCQLTLYAVGFGNGTQTGPIYVPGEPYVHSWLFAVNGWRGRTVEAIVGCRLDAGDLHSISTTITIE